MQTFLKIFLTCSFLFLSINFVVAAEAQKASYNLNDESKYSEEDLYSIYRFIQPQELLSFAREAARYAGKVGIEKAFPEFNKFPPSQWFSRWMSSPFIVPLNCEIGTIEAYPVPDLQKIIGQKSLLSQIKDINGKLYVVEGCRGIKKSPDGFFITERNVYNPGVFTDFLMVFVQIKDSPYQVISWYPTKKYSNFEEYNSKIAKGEW